MKKRNKLLLIVSAVFLVLGIAALISGLVLAGNDFIGMLTSKYAMLFYIVFGTYVLVVLSILIGDRIKRI